MSREDSFTASISQSDLDISVVQSSQRLLHRVSKIPRFSIAASHHHIFSRGLSVRILSGAYARCFCIMLDHDPVCYDVTNASASSLVLASSVATSVGSFSSLVRHLTRGAIIMVYGTLGFLTTSGKPSSLSVLSCPIAVTRLYPSVSALGSDQIPAPYSDF